MSNLCPKCFAPLAAQWTRCGVCGEMRHPQPEALPTSLFDRPLPAWIAGPAYRLVARSMARDCRKLARRFDLWVMPETANMLNQIADAFEASKFPGPLLPRLKQPVGCAACDRDDHQLGHHHDCPKSTDH